MTNNINLDLKSIDTCNKNNFDLSCCTRLEELRDKIGCSLPEYETFVMKYGHSEIGGMICVFAPNDILERLDEFRERWEEYFLWDNDDSALSEEEMRECFPLAETINGDQFVFKTKEKSGIYYLPRDKYTIFPVGKDLQDIVNFAMLSGKLFNPEEFYGNDPPKVLYLS
jgi:hypothetical protein